MSKITLKMLITEIGNTEMGMFSMLSCGEKGRYVLEPPWLLNQTNVSCIPAGIYKVIIEREPGHHNKYYVTNVAGRTHITIHVGNTVDDTKGCLMLGHKLGVLHEKWAILQSHAAMSTLKEWCEDVDDFLLYIDRPSLNMMAHDNNRSN